jgi:signal peptidase II
LAFFTSCAPLRACIISRSLTFDMTRFVSHPNNKTDKSSRNFLRMSRYLNKYSIISTIAVVTLGIDQLTKHFAREHLLNHAPLSYLHDFFILLYSINRGAFLGFGHDLPSYMRAIIFTGLVGVLLVAFSVFVFRIKHYSSSQYSAAALIIGGGVSNLYDRLANQGEVIDFMNLGIGFLRTGVFNLADLAILAGIFLLVIFTRASTVNREPPKEAL